MLDVGLLGLGQVGRELGHLKKNDRQLLNPDIGAPKGEAGERSSVMSRCESTPDAVREISASFTDYCPLISHVVLCGMSIAV